LVSLAVMPNDISKRSPEAATLTVRIVAVTPPLLSSGKLFFVAQRLRLVATILVPADQVRNSNNAVVRPPYCIRYPTGW
jgi:hypothetical protein